MNPLQVIEDNIQEFGTKGAELLAMRREALALLKVLPETSLENFQAIAELQRFEQDANAEYHKWVDEMSKVRTLIRNVNRIPGVEWEPLGSPSLAMVGVLSVTAGLAAVAMTAIIAKVRNLDRQLDAIEAGIDPAVVAKAAKSSGIGFGGFLGGIGTGGLIALGAVAFVMLRGKS